MTQTSDFNFDFKFENFPRLAFARLILKIIKVRKKITGANFKTDRSTFRLPGYFRKRLFDRSASHFAWLALLPITYKTRMCKNARQMIYSLTRYYIFPWSLYIDIHFHSQLSVLIPVVVFAYDDNDNERCYH